MNKTTEQQYEFALQRIEELLPLVDDNTPANDRNAVELTLMSDFVIAYEKEHFPISKPSVAQLISFSLEERNTENQGFLDPKATLRAEDRRRTPRELKWME